MGHAAAVRRRRAGGRARARGRTTRTAGSSPSIPNPARRASLDALHDDAWVREVGGFGPNDPSFGWMPDQKHVWFLSERDGWMHLYTRRRHRGAAGRAPADAGQVGDRRRSRSRPTGRSSTSRAPKSHPGERHIYAMPIDGGARTKLTSMTGGTPASVVARRQHVRPDLLVQHKPHEVYVMPNRAGAAATQVTTTPTEEWRSFKWVDPQLVTYKTRDGVDVYARLFTPEMIGAQARSGRAGRGLRARRRLPAERAQVLVELLPRVHVPQPARVARLRRARPRLPRQRRLRPRLAHGDLPPHGRQGSRRRRRRREVPGRRRRR